MLELDHHAHRYASENHHAKEDKMTFNEYIDIWTQTGSWSGTRHLGSWLADPQLPHELREALSAVAQNESTRCPDVLLPFIERSDPQIRALSIRIWVHLFYGGHKDKPRFFIPVFFFDAFRQQFGVNSNNIVNLIDIALNERDETWVMILVDLISRGAKLAPREVLDAFKKLVYSKRETPCIKRLIISKVSCFGIDAATNFLALLRASLRDEDVETRSEACSAISWLGIEAKQAVPDLARVIREDNPSEVRSRALVAIGRIRPTGGSLVKLIPDLIAVATRDSETGIRELAARTLLQLDTEAELFRVLSSDQESLNQFLHELSIIGSSSRKLRRKLMRIGEEASSPDPLMLVYEARGGEDLGTGDYEESFQKKSAIARRIGYSERRVTDFIKSGQLKLRKDGKFYYIKTSELNKFSKTKNK